MEAAAAHQTALTIGESHLPQDSPTLALLLANLADTYGKLQQHFLALPLWDRAVAIRETHRAEDPLAYATALNNAGIVCDKAGDPENAESYLRAALQVHEQSLNFRDSSARIVAANLSDLLRRRNRPDAGEIETLAQMLREIEQVTDPGKG